MSVLATLVGVSLRRTLRDRTALFFMLLFPILIIVVIGAVFGEAPTGVEVGVTDADRTAVSRRLIEAIERNDVVSVTMYDDLDALRRDVRTGAVGAGVVVPVGTGADVEAGRPVALPLVADVTRGSTSTVTAAVGGALTSEGVVFTAARFAADEAGLPYDVAVGEATRLAAGAERTDVVAETVDTGASLFSDNRFTYTVTANLILFTFINSLATGAEIVESRRLGVTRRMLAAPITPGAVLAGIGLARVTFALVQAGLLVVVGAVVFGVEWQDPLALGSVVVTWALVASGAGLVIGSLAKDAEQAQSLGIPVGIGLAMLGGCMWPLEIVPDVVRMAGHAFPHAWAMDAMIAVVFEDRGLGSVLPELAVLLAFAAVLLAAGAWFTRRAVTGSAAAPA